MSKETKVRFSFGTWFWLVITLAVFAGGNEDKEQTVKLTEYCERVAIYEATKHTNDVRGHRDFDENMECGE